MKGCRCLEGIGQASGGQQALQRCHFELCISQLDFA